MTLQTTQHVYELKIIQNLFVTPLQASSSSSSHSVASAGTDNSDDTRF